MISKKFDPSSFESKWQKTWLEKGIYQPSLRGAKRPFYNLMMFPYPSAEGLHVGNMYAFTGVDIYGRFKRMQGNDVFEPIGLDGFGIHSENYAIKIGKNPKDQAKISEKNFYRQLASIGNGFAWENRLETYDPDYYRFTQWLFVQMFKKGLAYKKKSPVNFCPSCKTVLSDEQVVKKSKPQRSKIKNDLGDLGHLGNLSSGSDQSYDGCERCGTQIEKRNLSQWFFRITHYAERLLQNTYRKDFHWSEKVKIGQRNWIGRSEGVQIEFKTQNSKLKIKVFTTAIDTIYGTTFMVLSPDHPLLKDKDFSVNFSENVKKYLINHKKTISKNHSETDKEKTGVFSGMYAINPFTKKKLPIWIADYVLMEYGTGAVMGVPGHDARDYEFAKKFDIPIIPVIKPSKRIEDKISINSDGFWDYADIKTIYSKESLLFNSEFLDNLNSQDAKLLLEKKIEEMKIGKKKTTYKLRDWCISRQRYWGAPIPMIFCSTCAARGDSWFKFQSEFPSSVNSKLKTQNSKLNNKIENCKLKIENSAASDAAGWFPVPEDQLPVLLPDLADWKPEGTGKGPLAKLPSFYKTRCPHCGGEADRETDVCDTFLDSSWYFLRYPSVNLQPTTDNSQLPWDREITRRWLPVSMYIGGAEHTVLHLLYSRFVWMCLYDWGYFNFSGEARPGSAWEEPYRQFYAHGLIIAEGAKMSKSRGNIIIPDEYIAKYGADTLRTYLMFLGPFDMGGDFRDTGIAGMYRFLGRVWRLVEAYLSAPKQPRQLKSPSQENSINRMMHKTIKEVTDDLENLRYNTAIAHIMEYVNEIQNSKVKSQNNNSQLTTDNLQPAKEAIETLLLLLAPFAPHMTEELFQKLKLVKLDQLDQSSRFTSIHQTAWPKYDPQLLVEDTITIVVQVNGKLRDSLTVDRLQSRDKNKVEKIAKTLEKVKKHLEGKPIRKTIFIPGRLINFVI